MKTEAANRLLAIHADQLAKLNEAKARPEDFGPNWIPTLEDWLETTEACLRELAQEELAS